MNILSKSPRETKKFGEDLGKKLKPGDVVALIGDLGAGKTCFTQGLMKGLGVASKNVTSPTFVLMNVYNGRLPVYHFDVYRLNGVREMDDLDYEDYFYGDGVAIVEWADKIEEILPTNSCKIYFTVESEKERKIEIKKYENIRH